MWLTSPSRTWTRDAMHRFTELIVRHWGLKVVSLALATLIWIGVASESMSEIVVDVPLEYRNVPLQSEILGDGTNTVEVRLRGPSRLIREIGSADISSTIDAQKLGTGETEVPLNSQNVSAPVGIEVLGVNPPRIHVTVEPTLTKAVPVAPIISGVPARGFHVAGSSVDPPSVTVQGPASRVQTLQRIQTTTIDVSDKRESIQVTTQLDPDDPYVRIRHIGPVSVKVAISTNP